MFSMCVYACAYVCVCVFCEALLPSEKEQLNKRPAAKK